MGPKLSSDHIWIHGLLPRALKINGPINNYFLPHILPNMTVPGLVVKEPTHCSNAEPHHLLGCKKTNVVSLSCESQLKKQNGIQSADALCWLPTVRPWDQLDKHQAVGSLRIWSGKQCPWDLGIPAPLLERCAQFLDSIPSPKVGTCGNPLHLVSGQVRSENEDSAYHVFPPREASSN